ncbi:tRNA epoxyqueuosine(34) reductase QueG [Natronospora cellulosivora (SeqCode)]
MSSFQKRNLTNKIKKMAKEIGFDLVGITTAEPFSKAYQVIKNRNLNKFIKNDKVLLTHPKNHLESAKSIIALALSYASSDISNQRNQYISLYARSKDYHLIMEEKMQEIIDYLYKIVPNFKSKAYCDTGSILDREVAYRAGLGWIGKSNNLINPVFGSYIVLGEIITNIDLIYDEPMQSRCNECSLCIDKCPAKAFKAPLHLDSEKCLSYITQKKGYLGETERNSIGNNLWGCDTCLSICPYNKKIPLDRHPEFKPKIEADSKQILELTKNNLTEAWKESAITWRGLRILKRNTLINMANKPEINNLPILIKELKNPSPVLRTYVVWALGEIKDNSISNILRKHYYSEKDENVLKEIKKLFKKKKSHWGELDD